MTMMKSKIYRELAKSYRQRASQTGVPAKANLLRNIAHSLSGLATQLEALAEVDKQPARKIDEDFHERDAR